MTRTLTFSQYQDKSDPWSSHSLIRARLAGLPPGTRVLDVGSATGTLGRMCQGMDLALYGLEPNEAWAQAARPFYREMRAATLDETPDSYLGGYERVVCADVLEHLPAPEQALARLASLQPPGAVFLLSVPNVANLWVRLNLLLGRFDYTERGILDRTHLRFFTRRTLLQLIQGCGLKVLALLVTPIPLPLVHPFFATSTPGRALYRLLAAVTRAFPTLLGYQFVAELHRESNDPT